MLDVLSDKAFRILDSTSLPLNGEALFPFAYEELECRRMGNGLATPLIHIWRHERAFIAGLRDRKLPEAEAALEWLEAQGYKTAVRHSGGAAVPLDAGVVNVSILLPKSEGKLDFKDDFQWFAQLLIEAVKPYSLARSMVGEVQGSYCPGEYDISIEGKKFSGLAQRRQTKGNILQAFVVVEGSGEERARTVRYFYEKACPTSSIDEQSRRHPEIQEDRVRSLSELTQITSVETFVSQLKTWLAPLIYEEVERYDPALMKEALQIMQELKARYNHS